MHVSERYLMMKDEDDDVDGELRIFLCCAA